MSIKPVYWKLCGEALQGKLCYASQSCGHWKRDDKTRGSKPQNFKPDTDYDWLSTHLRGLSSDFDSHVLKDIVVQSIVSKESNIFQIAIQVQVFHLIT